jgi:hypothetical protein
MPELSHKRDLLVPLLKCLLLLLLLLLLLRGVAQDLTTLAANPLAGIWAVYNTAQDPWQRQDFRSYRRTWFKMLTGFLSYGGGPNVKVNAAFVWSVGTWDVAGVSHISTSPQGTYADPVITNMMKALSTRVPY